MRYNIFTENEWARACNQLGRVWLYVIFACGTATPKLYRVQNPFGTLLFGVKGGVVIQSQSVLTAALQNEGE